MTKKINRYALKEIECLRIVDKQSGKVVEVKPDDMVQSYDLPKENRDFLKRLQMLQGLFADLMEDKDFLIEMDFEDE